MLYDFTDDSFRETAWLLDRAVELDPSYAQAHAHLAWRLNFWLGEGRSSNRKADAARALEASQRALALDPEDGFALTVAGQVLSMHAGRPKEAAELFDRALVLNENSAFAWGLSALTYAYLGQPDEALDRLQNVWRLSPFDPLNFYFWTVAGIAEFVAERYDEAIMWQRKANRANPRFVASLRILAASLALAGDEDRAADVGRALLRIEPAFRVGPFVAWYPLQRCEDKARLEAGLKAAGLPA
jgi:tetratricopeptide (TPR) repeat protein